MTTNQGFFLLKSRLTKAVQQEILAAARSVVIQAPLFRPTMANGQSFNYSMTNCGELGWVADRHGYRYQQVHPETLSRFPAMPQVIRDLAINLAKETGNDNFDPESCLINLYRKGEKLGMHQDNTEKNLSAPIISISLGDSGVFVLGGFLRTDETKHYIVQSGDIIVMSGESRNFFHSFKGTVPNTSNLLKDGGRLNLTIRQVN
ncbi:alkylated DNA repair dioxygenase [Chlorogloea sp. CCALA 695]|nr:alkylated DNA repair dioxygenase [Chlorogloea sp. CCALA 695]